MQKYGGVHFNHLALTHWPKPLSAFAFDVDGIRWDVKQFGHVLSQCRPVFDQPGAFQQNCGIDIADRPTQILSLKDGLFQEMIG